MSVILPPDVKEVDLPSWKEVDKEQFRRWLEWMKDECLKRGWNSSRLSASQFNSLSFKRWVLNHDNRRETRVA